MPRGVHDELDRTLAGFARLAEAMILQHTLAELQAAIDEVSANCEFLEVAAGRRTRVYREMAAKRDQLLQRSDDILMHWIEHHAEPPTDHT